jgi:hypothetical protein
MYFLFLFNEDVVRNNKLNKNNKKQPLNKSKQHINCMKNYISFIRIFTISLDKKEHYLSVVSFELCSFNYIYIYIFGEAVTRH